ncbi:glycerol-3-phosphate dehydrogenase/oxidase [Metabacillus bambusae]|uniref:Glycerol-3-phosphate dehydrogenase n=1 Tax=Metabacillus bambusae TaxID=2795218 RepID=A0ABS3N5N8_9BACI|nr:glycerol-3-phosphate dehydrogenase/oxidase [Metabacillus bambusae]MBO1513599.1 glycerol-3-phosphate dehydrogenase/oxidase [Metabacillus bambusae]
MNEFSSIKRSTYLNEMEKQPLDLLVIGGGITGTGIALDAQSRGLRTGLIEMQDFAAGTSSRSTKLVHGGLRYLKQLEVKLVAEVGKERAIVYENAPHVTTPVWMMLPIIENGTFGKFSTSIGLKVYDFLAGVKRSERRKMLNSGDTLSREPLLRKEGLKGSGVYVEYRTDDARLTLEVIKEAVNRGVLAVNYTRAEKFIYENGKLVGVQINDQLSGEKKKIYAKKIVNAAGPWVDTLREKDQSKKGKYLHLTKGVHLVVDGSKFPLKEAVYFDTPFNDGRMMFAIPRAGKTYVGTTDTNYNGSIDHPRMTTEDRDYILEASNYMFPNLNLIAGDVESSWVGLRPLIHEEGKDPSEISRKDEIFLSESGLITIAGGKLTGYRKMAESVVNLVLSQLSGKSKGFPACSTDRITLSGGNVGGSAGYSSFIQEKVAEGIKLGLTKEEAEKLVKRYGSNISHVYDVIRQSGNQAAESGLSVEVYASLLYGIQHEMVATLSDFFIRRTSALLFDINWVQKWKEPVSQYMATLLCWSKEEEIRYRDDLEKYIHDAVVPLDNEEQPYIQSI